MKKNYNRLKSLFKNLEKSNDLQEEILWAEIFKSAITDNVWLTKKAFNPGRMSASYPALYVLFRICDGIKPKSILELGLGESSKVFFQYANYYNAKYKVLEFNEEWIQFFSENVFDVRENIGKIGITKGRFKGRYIFGFNNYLEHLSGKYDCVFVDAPWESPIESRIEILEIVKNDLLEDDFVIVFDDTHRVGEQNTLKKLLLMFKEKNIDVLTKEYNGIKGTTVICSKSHQFLTSL